MKRRVIETNINMQKNRGFTLAEVLITLGIIGVVAALTLPSLIQKQQEKEIVTRLKKAYSVFSQAYLSAVNEKGTPDTWGGGTYNDTAGNTNLFNAFQPYIKFLKVCEANKADDCFEVKDNNLRGKVKVGILADGIIIDIFGRDKDCKYASGNSKALQNICGDITLYKDKKSYLGRFWITKYGIIPKGSVDESDTNTSYNFDYCLANAISTPESCTAWIIFNENMDYLRCKDLSWDGKRSCKDKN